MNKEGIIYCSNNEFIEKIAHEAAMAVAIAEFNNSFKCDMIKSTRESHFIINSYYQHKKWAINELVNNYDHNTI